MRLEWSAAALADLDRFAGFLHELHPRLAKVIAAEIKDKPRILVEHRCLTPPRPLSELRDDPAAADDLRDHMVALVALHLAAAHAAE